MPSAPGFDLPFADGHSPGSKAEEQANNLTGRLGAKTYKAGGSVNIGAVFMEGWESGSQAETTALMAGGAGVNAAGIGSFTKTGTIAGPRVAINASVIVNGITDPTVTTCNRKCRLGTQGPNRRLLISRNLGNEIVAEAVRLAREAVPAGLDIGRPTGARRGRARIEITALRRHRRHADLRLRRRSSLLGRAGAQHGGRDHEGKQGGEAGSAGVDHWDLRPQPSLCCPWLKFSCRGISARGQRSESRHGW